MEIEDYEAVHIAAQQKLIALKAECEAVGGELEEVAQNILTVAYADFQNASKAVVKAREINLLHQLAERHGFIVTPKEAQ